MMRDLVDGLLVLDGHSAVVEIPIFRFPARD